MKNNQNSEKIIWEKLQNFEDFNQEIGHSNSRDQFTPKEFAGFWIRLLASILDAIIFYCLFLLTIYFVKIFYFDVLGFPNEIFFTVADKKTFFDESVRNLYILFKNHSSLELILGSVSLIFRNLFQGFIGSNSLDLIVRSVKLFFLICAVCFLASRFQATLGKMIVGIYVGTSQDGSRISIYRSFFRCVIDSILYLIIPITVGAGLSLIKLSVFGDYSGSFPIFLLISMIVTFFIILLINLLMVVFTKEKTALHDLICGTRVFYGRK